MEHKKEGQITLFMILGIVLLIIVAFIFYLSNYTQEKKGQEITGAEKTAFDITPIKEYVTTCLDNTAKDGLLLLGKQGGYIYTSQGGTLRDFKTTDENEFYVNYNNNIVSYGIYPPRYKIGAAYFSEPPNYPTEIFPYPNSASIGTNNVLFIGYFGLSNLPPLNDSDGAHSIHLQLGNYINNYLKECINLDVFREQGFEIKEEAFNADVSIAKNDISLHLTYPLEIKKLSTGEVTEIKDFYAKINVRLSEFYNFIKELIDNDISDISFDIDQPVNDRDGFSIAVVRNINSKNDDLAIAKDSRSLVKGQPYEYRFARHNRYPALYFIYICEPDHKCKFYKGGLSITKTDIINQGIAIDPDEDEITTDSFSYTSNGFNCQPPNQAFPCQVSDFDVNIRGNITFTAKVTDGILEDYQEIVVDALAGSPP